MYTIYHIPQTKIGCTQREVLERVQEQGYSEYEVLEIHTDKFIAGDRELHLQQQFGYRIDDMPFYARDYKEMGRKGGKTRHKQRMESGEWNLVQKLGAKVSNSIQANKICTCPHCGKTIQGINYKRWHGDNCKAKK
jgi:hypothetical protein